MRVEPLREGDGAKYQQFLAGHPAAMLTYDLRFRDLLCAAFGFRADYRVAVEGGAIRGILPLMAVEGALGKVINSLPFYGSHGAVLADAPEVRLALYEEYRRVTRADGVVAATMVGNPLDADPAPWLEGRTHEDLRIGQFTDLACSAEAEDVAGHLMGRFDGKTRNMIRKAAKLGVAVSRADEALDWIASVHTENIVALGGVAKPRVFFDVLPRHFRAGQDYRIYEARLNGERVAGLLLFRFGRTIEYFTPVIVPEHRDAQGLSAIIHHAMTEAVQEHFALWNWGGTWTTQDGVYRFKRRWDAVDKPYRYFVQVNDDALLERTRGEILAAYPFTYVLPFSALRELQ